MVLNSGKSPRRLEIVQEIEPILEDLYWLASMKTKTAAMEEM